MDHTVLGIPAIYTMPAFTPQPLSITALWLVPGTTYYDERMITPRQFKSDCHQMSSVILLPTGDEVIKLWKVKVKGQGRWGRYALH